MKRWQKYTLKGKVSNGLQQLQMKNLNVSRKRNTDGAAGSRCMLDDGLGRCNVRPIWAPQEIETSH